MESDSRKDKLRELQLTELEIFKKVDAICRKEGITYFAMGGTLLGAVRHKGFIPWDDDIDIGLPRNDYERFITYCENNEVGFELHTFRNDDNYHRYFARCEDPSIKLIRTDRIKEELSSAWIDVFPLDGMPNNRFLRFVHKIYLLYRRKKYNLSRFEDYFNRNLKRPLWQRIIFKTIEIIPVYKLLDTKKELNKLDRALKRVSFERNDYLINLLGAYVFNEMFHKKHYGKGHYYPFEDIEIYGPDDYDFICKQLYGDYMKEPEEDEKNHHESEII